MINKKVSAMDFCLIGIDEGQLTVYKKFGSLYLCAYINTDKNCHQTKRGLCNCITSELTEEQKYFIENNPEQLEAAMRSLDEMSGNFSPNNFYKYARVS